MSPILDASGQPLPPTRPQPDVLDQFCNNRDGVKDGWDQAMQRYEALLAALEPHAGPMVEMLSGKMGLDATKRDGQEFIRLIIDIGLMSLMMRRHAFRQAARESNQLEQDGGQRAPQ